MQVKRGGTMAAPVEFVATCDSELFAALRTLTKWRAVGTTQLPQPHAALAAYVKDNYSATELADLETVLHNLGVLDIQFEPVAYPTRGGNYVGTRMPATNVKGAVGEMNWLWYLRDGVEAARGFMETYMYDHSRSYEYHMGRKLLFTSLHALTTPAQLGRLDDVIARGPAAGQADWPHISLLPNDLLTKGPNHWRNKQDTLAMTVHLTADALLRGYIKPRELTAAHRYLLASFVPLLQAVGYPCYESSGSWEELAAVRTSVMAVETASLAKLQQLLECDAAANFTFLQKSYARRHGRSQPAPSLRQAVDQLLHKGLHTLANRWAYEAPDYPVGSAQHRRADAALLYLVRFDLPQLLARHGVPVRRSPNAQPMTERELENALLAEIDTLNDPHTGGIRRYLGDSYQATNWNTYEKQAAMTALKDRLNQASSEDAREIDLDSKQQARNKLFAGGREAAWTHPVLQRSSWAAKRCLQSLREGDLQAATHYRAQATTFLNRGLSLVSVGDRYHAVMQLDGSLVLRPFTGLTEALLTMQDNQATFIIASTHGPLNWSTAMLRESLALLKTATRELEAHVAQN